MKGDTSFYCKKKFLVIWPVQKVLSCQVRPHLISAAAGLVSATDSSLNGPQVDVNWKCHSFRDSRWCVALLETLSSRALHCDRHHWWKMLSAMYSFPAQPPYVPTFLIVWYPSWFSTKPGLTGHIGWADRWGRVTDTLLIVSLHFPAVWLRYLCNFGKDRKTDLYSVLLDI